MAEPLHFAEFAQQLKDLSYRPDVLDFPVRFVFGENSVFTLILHFLRRSMRIFPLFWSLPTTLDPLHQHLKLLSSLVGSLAPIRSH